MHLFVFESLGTSELILIGIVALVFLGPRKLPEMARKVGKIMAEFRGTANEFKQTWQREVDFEEEAKALDINELEKEAERPTPVPRSKELAAPTVREVDRDTFGRAAAEATVNDQNDPEAPPSSTEDKRNWL